MSFRTFDEQSDFDGNDESDAEAFVAGERLCAPSVSQAGSTMLSASVVIGLLLGIAWIGVSYPAAWQAVVSVASKVVDQHPGAAPAPNAAQLAYQPVLQSQLPETREIAAAPGAEAGEAAPPPSPSAETAENVAQKTATEAEDLQTQTGEVQQSGDETPVRLPPPKADPSNPNQKRALAAGLHPDLSHALLSRLTDADYSNANKAIKTALAETPDEEVFTWPREAIAKRAQFEVKFVAGTSPECRRYVVIVTKDRWSTTAPPMEKCGSDLPKRKDTRQQGRKDMPKAG